MVSAAGGAGDALSLFLHPDGPSALLSAPATPFATSSCPQLGAVDVASDSADASGKSPGHRFRVARRLCFLGGRLLVERHDEHAVGVVVGARSLLNHGGREAERSRRIARPSVSRASTTALRPAKRTSTDPGSTSPDAWIRRRTASGVSLIDTASGVDAAPGSRSSGGGAGIVGAPPQARRTSRRNTRDTRAVFTRPPPCQLSRCPS
jgi:hypothetical protein